MEMGADGRNGQESSFRSHDESLFLAKGDDLTHLEIGYFPGDENLFTFCLFPPRPEKSKGATDQFSNHKAGCPDPGIRDQSPSEMVFLSGGFASISFPIPLSMKGVKHSPCEG